MAASFAAAAAAVKSSAGRSSTRAARATRDRFAAAIFAELVVSSAAAEARRKEVMAEVLNIQQLAQKIGKSRRTVWRWVKKGWLPEPLYVKGWPVWDSEAVRRRLEQK